MSAKLSGLVRLKMENEHLSLRSAAEQIGVAHTTVDRVLKEEPVDLTTLEKICDWVGIPVTAVLDISDDNNEVMDQLSAAMALCPELSDVFTEIAEKVLKGELEQSILSEVASFASYRLNLHKRKVEKNESANIDVLLEN